MEKNLANSQVAQQEKKTASAQYLDAKYRYLQERKLLEQAKTRLSSETMERTMPQQPAAIRDQAEPASKPSRPKVLLNNILGVIAGVVLGCAFALIALIALVACLMTRRRNMERARLELAARSNTSWLDPKLVAVGVQIGQAIGWRRLAALGALAVLAAAAAKEWSGRDKPSADDDEAEDGD